VSEPLPWVFAIPTINRAVHRRPVPADQYLRLSTSDIGENEMVKTKWRSDHKGFRSEPIRV